MCSQDTSPARPDAAGGGGEEDGMVQEAGVPEESGDAERRLREAWSALLEDADRIADEIAAATLGGDQGGAWSTPELRARLRRSTRE
ncbi:hypothetical protein GQ85_22870, partial [Rhodococcus rhodochrous]